MFDEQLLALASVHRRRLLLALMQEGVERTPTEVPDGDGPESGVERTVQMHHVHLPKLAHSGYISWDQRSGTVSRGPRYDEIEPLLAMVRANGDELPADAVPAATFDG